MKSAVRLFLALVLCAALGWQVVGHRPAAAAPRPLLTDSLIAYFTLNEIAGVRFDTLSNCGGSGCDLTDNNSTGYAAGKINNAADFEMASLQYLSHADNADWDTGDIDYTWWAWVYPESTNGSPNDHRPIISKVGEYFLTWLESGHFQMYDVTSGSYLTEQHTGAGQWYLVVGGYRASDNKAFLSINGAAKTFGNAGSNASSGTGAVYIGRVYGGSTELYWDGLIDEAGFSKKLLSDQEITDLYNASAGCTHDFAACDSTYPTATPTNTPIPPTATDTPIPPTATETPTVTPSSTSTPTPISTSTCTPEFECTVLSTGNRFAYVRVITFGDVLIAIIIVALALFAYVTWSHNATRDLFR